MDDCLVCYGKNGEPVRPQQGFPLRLMVPGFEGIYQTKYLRRIKVVDRYYMTYNDYGHLQKDPKVVALTVQIGPKSVITFPSAGQQLSGPGFYEISGLAWSGGGAVRRVEVSTDGGRSWKDAEFRTPVYRMAHTRFAYCGNGTEKPVSSCRAAPMNWAPFNPREPRSPNSGTSLLTPDFRVKGADNTIQPWRIASDGSVHNGNRIGFSCL